MQFLPAADEFKRTSTGFRKLSDGQLPTIALAVEFVGRTKRNAVPEIAGHVPESPQDYALMSLQVSKWKRINSLRAH